MSEETIKAEHSGIAGVVGAIVLTGVLGLGYLVSIMYAMQVRARCDQDCIGNS